MKNFIAKIKEVARADPRRVVFPESTEERTLRAIEVILHEGTAKPILIGRPEDIWQKIHEFGLNVDGEKLQIVDHTCDDNKAHLESYAKEFFELRKHRNITLDKARDMLKDETYYGTMMVHLGDADGLISGAIHTTGHTIRPALQIIKAREKFHKVSGAFFIKYQDKIMVFADAAVTISPDAKDLAGIAIDSARTAKRFGLEPKVAMLCFSTKGSATHPFVDKMKEATAIAQDKAKELMPDVVIEGEMQLDAAVEPWVAEIKCPDSLVKGDANVLVFPDLQSANIGYKLATFFGKAQAIGPILQGLRKPVNDLSRSCTVPDIVDIAAFTVIEAHHVEKGEE